MFILGENIIVIIIITFAETLTLGPTAAVVGHTGPPDPVVPSTVVNVARNGRYKPQ